MILLSLASKQIWPQVLAVAHLKPERFFLLHSDDLVGSKGPALFKVHPQVIIGAALFQTTPTQ